MFKYLRHLIDGLPAQMNMNTLKSDSAASLMPAESNDLVKLDDVVNAIDRYFTEKINPKYMSQEVVKLIGEQITKSQIPVREFMSIYDDDKLEPGKIYQSDFHQLLTKEFALDKKVTENMIDFLILIYSNNNRSSQVVQSDLFISDLLEL